MITVAALLFLGGLILGQVGGISVGGEVTVYLYDVALALLLSVAWMTRTNQYLRLRLFEPILLFVIVGAVSLLVNAHRFALGEVGVSALYALRFALYAGLYWVVVSSRLSSMFWMWGLFATGSVVAAVGLVQYQWYPYLRNLSYLGWDPHLYRVFSTLLDPNFAGLLFVMTIWLGLVLWQKAKTYRWIVIAGEVVSVVALFLTYSRAAYLAFIVGGLVLAWHTRKLKIALIVIAVFIGILFLLPRKDGEGVKLLRTASTFARVGNWQRGFTLISQKPMLGHGFNTLRYVQRKMGWVDDSQIVSHAGAGLDNSFQFIWATTGILGVVSFFGIVITLLRLAHGALLNKSTAMLGVVVFVTLTSVGVDSLFTNSIFFPQVALWMWVLAGILERDV